jgi:hypothetical protein
MAFLLAGIPALLFPAWPLGWLFLAVYDQSFGLLATDPQNSLSQFRGRLMVDLSA